MRNSDKLHVENASGFLQVPAENDSVWGLPASGGSEGEIRQQAGATRARGPTGDRAGLAGRV